MKKNVSIQKNQALVIVVAVSGVLVLALDDDLGSFAIAIGLGIED